MFDVSHIRMPGVLSRPAGMLVVLGLIAAGCSDPTLAGIVREPPPAVSEISLPDMAAGGGEFTTTAEPGGLLLVYFGYTNCSDICPTTMADLRKTLTDLGDGVERIEVAMITVDPERDIPDPTGGIHPVLLR